MLHPAHGALQTTLGINQEVPRGHDGFSGVHARQNDHVAFELRTHLDHSRFEHAALVQPILDTLPPLFHFVTPIPYTELQKMLDESAPWGILAYEKAVYLDELTEALAARTERLCAIPSVIGGEREICDDVERWARGRFPHCLRVKNSLVAWVDGSPRAAPEGTPRRRARYSTQAPTQATASDSFMKRISPRSQRTVRTRRQTLTPP